MKQNYLKKFKNFCRQILKTCVIEAIKDKTANQNNFDCSKKELSPVITETNLQFTETS